VSLDPPTRIVALALSMAALAIVPATLARAEDLDLPPSPASSLVCPGIEEDGLLCSADLLSGNCADFVAVADALGALYRSELAKLPDSEEQLQTTLWWGCGPGNLSDVKKLLVRIGSPRAQAVLQTEPYRSLPPVRVEAPPPSTSPPTIGCDDVWQPLEKTACIGSQLQAARAYQKNAFEACKAQVAPALRDDLVAEEASFQATLPARCDAQAADAGNAGEQAFARSHCLVVALTDNANAMLQAHPECAGPE
jgi:hypothetical protein